MKSKKLFTTLIIIIISIFAGCDSDNKDYVGLKELGIDKSQGHLDCYIDNHGGFLGDGCTYIEIKFSGDYSDTIENELSENQNWRSFPLTKNLQTAVYGDENFASLLNISDEIPSIPKITNGYYYFKDRHRDSTDNSDDTNLLSRNSFNFDIIIYDMDEDILYIFQLDT